MRSAQSVSADDNPLTEKHGQCTDPGCAGLNELLLRANLRLLPYSFPTWVKCSESEEAYMQVEVSPKMPMHLHTASAAVYKEPRDWRLSVSPLLFPPPSDARRGKLGESNKNLVICPNVEQLSALLTHGYVAHNFIAQLTKHLKSRSALGDQEALVLITWSEMIS